MGSRPKGLVTSAGVKEIEGRWVVGGEDSDHVWDPKTPGACQCTAAQGQSQARANPTTLHINEDTGSPHGVAFGQPKGRVRNHTLDDSSPPSEADEVYEKPRP